MLHSTCVSPSQVLIKKTSRQTHPAAKGEREVLEVLQLQRLRQGEETRQAQPSCLPILSIDLLLMAVSLTPRQFCCALWSPSSSSSSCELMEDRGCCDSMLFVGCLAQAARVFCAHAWRNCNNSWPPLRPCNGIIPLVSGRSLMVRSLCVCPFS